MIGNAFASSKPMFAAIMAFVSPSVGWDEAVALANVGEYKSRGKGKGKSGTSSAHCVAMDRRAAVKARNRAKHREHCR